MIFSVSDKQLYNRTALLGRKTVKGVSLCPFFDIRGRVDFLMLVFKDSDKIYMIPRHHQKITLGLSGQIRIHLDRSTLESYTNFNTNLLKDVFHFDPNWILDDSRFVNHWATTEIKRRNCFNRFPSKASIAIFTRDLSKLRSIKCGYDSRRGIKRMPSPLNLNEMNMEMPAMGLVLESAKPKLPPETASGWVVQPIWQEWHSLSYKKPSF